MKIFSKEIFIIMLCLIQFSCGNTAREQISLERRLFDMGLEQGESVSRLSSYRVNGWRSIDDENLVIATGVNDDYLVTLQAPCFDLESAIFIGFTTTAGSLDRFESIVVEGPIRRREFCRIREIFKLYDITPAAA